MNSVRRKKFLLESNELLFQFPYERREIYLFIESNKAKKIVSTKKCFPKN